MRSRNYSKQKDEGISKFLDICEIELKNDTEVT